VRDVVWLAPDGQEMGDGEWQDAENRCLGMLLDARARRSGSETGRFSTLLLIVNGHDHAVEFQRPQLAGARHWRRIIGTADTPPAHAGSGPIEVAASSVLLLQAHAGGVEG